MNNKKEKIVAIIVAAGEGRRMGAFDKVFGKLGMLELESIKLGVNGIVLPSRNTIEYAKSNGYRINNYETCCAINR